MLNKIVCGLLAAGLLQACAQAPGPGAPPPAQPPGPARCNADAARFAVGQPITPQLAEQARERAGAQRVRVIRPGQMVTMEFDPGRLNVEVDEGGRVKLVRCG